MCCDPGYMNGVSVIRDIPTVSARMVVVPLWNTRVMSITACLE